MPGLSTNKPMSYGWAYGRARRGDRVVLSDEQWDELVARGVQRHSVPAPADHVRGAVHG